MWTLVVMQNTNVMIEVNEVVNLAIETSYNTIYECEQVLCYISLNCVVQIIQFLSSDMM